MPYPELKAILTDVGTEELGHLEMVGTIVYQLTRSLTPEQIKAAGYDAYFVNHTTGVYPQNASGEPFNADGLASTGDTLADIHEDLAAEQKARMTYDNILRFCGDEPDVRDAIRFLRAREIVHYQRFGEGLRIITDNLDDRNFYAFNPAFDKGFRGANTSNVAGAANAAKNAQSNQQISGATTANPWNAVSPAMNTQSNQQVSGATTANPWNTVSPAMNTQSNQQVSGATMATKPWNAVSPATEAATKGQSNQQVSGATTAAKPWNAVSPATEAATKGQSSSQQTAGAASQKSSVSPAYTWNFK